MKKPLLKKKLPKELVTVTPLSKGIAMVVFILLPFIGFLIGVQYQENVSRVEYQESLFDTSYNQVKYSPLNQSNNNYNTVCTQEAKMCPDGSYVGRVGPRCEFSACPTE
jgi:hypothetical protein